MRRKLENATVEDSNGKIKTGPCLQAFSPEKRPLVSRKQMKDRQIHPEKTKGREEETSEKVSARR